MNLLWKVSPAAGIIKSHQIAEITVNHDEFHTLEEFVDGVPQNWWCEDDRDQEVMLVVKVHGSCTTESRSHRIRLRHCFSGKIMRTDNKNSSGHNQANLLRRSDFQRLSCSSDVVDHLRNLDSP
ncbi:phosphoinositide 5-phosphatase [Sarracenia purpurea var. burkii]